eukprot:TRINITY_DN542_c0_g1_i1.p1 TRINITY_DN542_c0_g1~~TRINITY_DN542_c0_g1_i1.p1  ORF type:complete len:243 (+),score=67.82 TRINITY_DN542_c0_g1_i1:544-1272(+)
MKKGTGVVIPLVVTLEDLYLGKEFKVLHKKQQFCSHCRGTGADDPNDVTTCPVCKGSGVKLVVQQLAPGFVQQMQTTCDKCGGKGKIINSKCPLCKGKKVQPGQEYINVYVEKGMAEGATINFDGQGDEVPDTLPGDVTFQVSTAPHPRFIRKGHDLYVKMTITLLEALTGFKRTLSHLDKRKVPVERTDITIPGYVMKISEEGMPHHDDPSTHGDLFVEFTVRFPTSLTEEQIKEIKRIFS